MTWLLIAALILWALGVWWWIIMDSTKQEKQEARERDLIMESYRDHERR
jgi:cbb3-type cytochrome oxidase subunit 3